jgi:hypothetical protein
MMNTVTLTLTTVGRRPGGPLKLDLVDLFVPKIKLRERENLNVTVEVGPLKLDR